MTADIVDNEEVAYTAYLSWWPFGVKLALAGVLGAVGALAFLARSDSFLHYFSWLTLLALFGAVGLFLKKGSVTAQVTLHHVFVKRELVNLHTTTLNLHRIESVDIDQSFLQRMLGYGNVVIRGLGSEDIVLKGLALPQQFKEAVLTVREERAL